MTYNAIYGWEVKATDKRNERTAHDSLQEKKNENERQSFLLKPIVTDRNKLLFGSELADDQVLSGVKALGKVEFGHRNMETTGTFDVSIVRKELP